ncbi:MAG: dihydroorotate dehydrogenase-like protein [Acidimicrobiia bacterium]|nr:MAG: dihydroorotate dehydrogenase-like protein [Acidimicrobiia bacterium]
MKPALHTTYLGMRLRNPFVLSASPIGSDVDRLLRYEEAGAAAVVLPSLFEEQIDHDAMRIHAALERGSHSFPEALTFLPEMEAYNTGPQRYLDLVRRARAELGIPVIASLNGDSPGGWTSHARRIEDAGASALELNVYLIAADPEETSEHVERRYLDVVEGVRRATTLPLAVKVGPFFSAMANMARRIVDAGADGLVLFNRFYQPDIDLEHLVVRPDVQLSQPADLRLPLRWIAMLHGRVEASLAATSGVHDHSDAIKLLLAGADVTMMASALLRNGPERLAECVAGLGDWLAEREYTSVEQMQGSMSWKGAPNPGAFERANYMETLASYHLDA